jgi:hypothetical protein
MIVCEMSNEFWGIVSGSKKRYLSAVKGTTVLPVAAATCPVSSGTSASPALYHFAENCGGNLLNRLTALARNWST